MSIRIAYDVLNFVDHTLNRLVNFINNGEFSLTMNMLIGMEQFLWFYNAVIIRVMSQFLEKFGCKIRNIDELFSFRLVFSVGHIFRRCITNTVQFSCSVSILRCFKFASAPF